MARVFQKVKGQQRDSETWEDSADGKVFAYTELDAGEAKPITGIYDRI